jgi:hypothetical protein
MADQLMAEQIEIDPLCGATTFGAPQDRLIKMSRLVDVSHLQSHMKWCQVHLYISATLPARICLKGLLKGDDPWLPEEATPLRAPHYLNAAGTKHVAGINQLPTICVQQRRRRTQELRNPNGLNQTCNPLNP